MILETVVPPAFPEEGPIKAIIYGEAPGPRGADKSARPFWGDRAGLLLYKGLHQADGFSEVMVDMGFFGQGRVAIQTFEGHPSLFPWKGERFASEGIIPVLQGFAISNAWPICPVATDEKLKFKRPSNKQLASPENIQRIVTELEHAKKRCQGVLKVICLGTASRWVFEVPIAKHEALQGTSRHFLPHPAPQGILSMGRDLPKPLSVPNLQADWLRLFREAVQCV